VRMDARSGPEGDIRPDRSDWQGPMPQA
jgi:hypothetical protein